jgi:hypothetical protein
MHLIALIFCRTAYRFPVECYSNIPYCLTILAKDEVYLEDEAKYLADKCGVRCREIEEQAAALAPGAWSILFRYSVYPLTQRHGISLQEEAVVSANLYLPEQMASGITLHIVDTSSGYEMPFPMLPMKLSPGRYIVVAETRGGLNGRAAFKWKYRNYLMNGDVTVPDKEPSQVKFSTVDLDGEYVQNKHNLIFR